MKLGSEQISFHGDEKRISRDTTDINDNTFCYMELRIKRSNHPLADAIEKAHAEAMKSLVKWLNEKERELK